MNVGQAAVFLVQPLLAEEGPVRQMRAVMLELLGEQCLNLALGLGGGVSGVVAEEGGVDGPPAGGVVAGEVAEESIASLVAMANVDRELATSLLEQAGGCLEQAIDTWFAQ